MPRFKAGDHVVWASDLSDPTTVEEGVVTRVGSESGQDTVWIGNRGVFFADFMWPGRVTDHLIGIIAERQKLKKAYDDSMKLIYELRNQIARGEI